MTGENLEEYLRSDRDRAAEMDSGWKNLSEMVLLMVQVLYPCDGSDIIEEIVLWLPEKV